MSRYKKLNILSILVIGIIITWGKYTIVIGQTVTPVLIALNKADSSLAIIAPGEMKVLGKVATGDSPHEAIQPDAALKIDLENSRSPAARFQVRARTALPSRDFKISN